MLYSLSMRWRIGAIVLGILAVSGWNSHAVPAAELKENYQPIIERNPFGLKPPPPPPTNNTATAKQDNKAKTEIFLTGITSIGYPKFPKQVYLMTKEQGPKTEPKYYALTEGVEKDGIRVLEIDPVNRKVRVKWEDEETMLSFQTHGIAPPATPAAGKPGVPGQPGMPMPQPGSAPIPMPAVHNAAVPGMAQPQPISQTSASGITPNATATYRQIPTRRIRGAENPGYSVNPQPNAAYGGGVQQPQQEQLDPAEQYLRMHLNKTVQEKQGMVMPPIPPM